MIPLHHDPWFTFRFADDRIIPRFHLEEVGAGRRVKIFKIDLEALRNDRPQLLAEHDRVAVIAAAGGEQTILE